MQSTDIAFEAHVKQLMTKLRGIRIHQFEYQGKRFWLKQPEQYHGICRLVLANPKKSFQREIQSLLYFASVHAPVPRLCLYGEDFFVLEDAGKTAIDWQAEPTLSRTLKQQILSDCVKALIELHQQNLIHGRPALRDMTWREGRVKFIDLEAYSNHQTNLLWQKAKDVLIFLHGLCRSKWISDEEVQRLIQLYMELGNPHVWLLVQQILRKYRFIYFLLLPFKPIAKTDLIAIYRLFENMSAQFKKEGK